MKKSPKSGSWSFIGSIFSLPSFFSGFARSLDLSGQFDEYNNSSTPQEADSRALISDMMAVASDIKVAKDSILSIGEEEKEKDDR